jgi:site-specific recombinase XerD
MDGRSDRRLVRVETAGTTEIVLMDHVLDAAITQWLAAKKERTGSDHTRRAYAAMMHDFRAWLWQHGCDLSSDVQTIIAAAQVWAGHRDIDARRKGDLHVAGATYNKRLACISSFYKFAVNHGNLAGLTQNPIRSMERRPANSVHAPVLDNDDIGAQLAKIDRATLAGLRDYALIAVALTTGRRAAELAGLRFGDVERKSRKRIILHFRHCKGGKQMEDELPDKTAKVLMEYLEEQNGKHLDEVSTTAPLWVSFSPNNDGGAISTQAIADIFADRLGISTVHSTRHIFALRLDKVGAPVSFISRKLGHSNIATTDKYLKSMPPVENPYGDQLADMFGIGEA